MKTRIDFRSGTFGNTTDDQIAGLRDFLLAGLPMENVTLGEVTSDGGGTLIAIKTDAPVDISLWCGLSAWRPHTGDPVFSIETRPLQPKVWRWRKLGYDDIQQDLRALLKSVENLLTFSPDIYDLTWHEVT